MISRGKLREQLTRYKSEALALRKEVRALRSIVGKRDVQITALAGDLSRLGMVLLQEGKQLRSVGKSACERAQKAMEALR